MNKMHDISDDLWVKFLNDKASEKETNLVLDYLSESEEHLEDFLTMCAALESHWDEEKIRYALKHRRNSTRFLWWTSAAAAAIAIIIGCVFFFQNNGGDQEPVMAQHQQKEHYDNCSDSTTKTFDTIREEGTCETDGKQNIPQQKSQKLYADSSRKYNYASMIYPTKGEVSIANKRSVTLRWNSDAINVHLKIVADDVTILDENLGSAKMYQLQIDPGVATYYWSIVFELPNKTTIEKTGKITNRNTVIN